MKFSWQQVALVALGAGMIIATGPIGLVGIAATASVTAGSAIVGAVLALHDPKKGE